jgi:hypothetical protein
MIGGSAAESGESNESFALELLQQITHRAVKIVEVRPPIILSGAIRFMDHQDVDGITLEQSEALVNRSPQHIFILWIKRLRSSAELCREVVRLRHTLQRKAQHLLTVSVAGRCVHVVYTEAQCTPNSLARFIASPFAHRRDEQAAHSQHTHLKSGSTKTSFFHIAVLPSKFSECR